MQHQQHQLRNSGRKRVCLFGTSANPPTGDGGHRGIVQALCALRRRFDEIRILPVYQHMFASKRTLLEQYEHRITMCQLNFGDLDKVVVSKEEEEVFHELSEGLSEEECQSLRVGTADLLDVLKARNPNTDYTFCMGADTFRDLTKFKWKRSKDVFKLLDGRLIVLDRKSEEATTPSTIDNNKNSNNNTSKDINNTSTSTTSSSNINLEELVSQINESESAQVELLKVPCLSSVSSSMIRATRNEDMLVQNLHPQVLEYIKTNQLYSFST